LWYPLSKKGHILGTTPFLKDAPPRAGASFNGMVLVTNYLLDWMGYEGKNYSDKKESFLSLLKNNSIPFEEITYNDCRFVHYPGMKNEIANTKKNILERKKWIVILPRNFKEAVLDLNTKNAKIVKRYYLNLEEACFEYAEYQANWLREKAELESKLKEEELMRSMSLLAIKDTELEKS
ncbi:hypothetical protein TCON_2849, partial [Astathelohania contejeani]